MPETLSPIKFGTSGWRGLIARDFTFDNVRLATAAIARYLRAEMARKGSSLYQHKPTLVMGHDTRFLGQEFTLAAAAVLAQHELTPLICDRDVPTPVIAHTIRARKTAGGINMTASHNPAEYQGLKFSTANGAPAPPEVTSQVEAEIPALLSQGWLSQFQPPEDFTFKTIDPRPDYVKQIHKLVQFETIQKAKMKIAVELVYGTGRGYLDSLLEEAGARITVFHGEPNPLFGGHPPEPNQERMAEVSRCVRRGEAQLGLGVDGDADRFGVVDQDGTWLTPNQVLALTLYHLKKNRRWNGRGGADRADEPSGRCGGGVARRESP